MLRAVALSDRTFRLLCEHSPMGVMLFSGPHGVPVSVNAAASRILGWTEECLMASTIDSITHPDDWKVERRHIQQLELAELEDAGWQKRFVSSGGHALLVDVQASIIRDEDSATKMLVYMFQLRSSERRHVDDKSGRTGVDLTETQFPEPVVDAKESIAKHEWVEALMNSERTMKRAERIAGFGIWTMHIATQMVEWSDETCRIFEVPCGTRIFYDDFLAFVHDDDRAMVDEAWRLALAGKGEYDLQHRIVSRGKTKWVREQCEFEHNAKGQPHVAVGVVTDITEEKLAKEQLEKKNKELQEVMDALDESSLVSIADKRGTILKVNRRFCEVAKYREEELVGKSHNIINSGFHSEIFWRDFWQTIATGEVWRGEIRNRAKDGSEYWVNTTINPIRNEKGEIVHYLSIRQDITSRKIFEELLLQSNLRLAQIEEFIDLTTDAIHVTEPDGRFVYINQVASQRLGVARDACRAYQITNREFFFSEGFNWKEQIGELKKCGTMSLEGSSYNQSTETIFPAEVTMRYISTHGKDYVIVVSRDITERRQNESELRESQARLAEAQRMAKLGYCEYNFSSGKVWWSEEQYRINGLPNTGNPPTREEFVNMIHPDDRQAFVNMMDRTIATMTEGTCTYRLIRPDGEVRVISALLNVVLNEGRGIEKLSGVHQDITERLITEKALRESEETLRKAQAVAKIGSWKLDVGTNVLHWSEEAYRIFNVPQEKNLTYTDFLSYIHPEDREYVERSWAAALEGAPYDIVHRIVVGRHVKWVREQAELTFDHLRNLLFGFGTVQDITDQKALQDSILIFNQSLLLTGLGSWRISFKNHDRFLSDNVYNLHGFTKETAPETFEHFLGMIHRDDRLRIAGLIEKVMTEKTSFATEYRVVLSTGETRWLSANGKVLFDEVGMAVEMYGIVRDVTAEKNSTAELIKARKEAEEASLIKDEFLSVMSHEIRTPLNSVIGLSNLILRRNPRKDQLEIMQILKGSADNLLHLVNDILDFNKIRAGKLELEFIPFRLTTFLQHLYASFKLSAFDKHIDFSIHTDSRIPDMLVGDVTRLNQIFNNLLGNAIKFTDEGHVKFRVDLKSKTEKECVLVFQIEDTGVGITPDKIETIFQPFQQSERDTSRKYGGTGLGLSIVKSLLHILEGTIEVRSTPGKGSVFKVELSFTCGPVSTVRHELLAPRSVVKEPSYSSLSRFLRVLYVEDVDSNRFLIEHLLFEHNIEATTVASGRQALQLTKAENFDLILMDIQMPGMDGYKTTAKIRQQREGKNRTTPVLAFTAEPYSDELRRKVAAHGMQDVITKPFDDAILIEKVMKCTEWRSVGEKVFSFAFYERAFRYDSEKLQAIKAAVLKDVRRFKDSLILFEAEKNREEMRNEIHRIRPILSKLECDQLVTLLNCYDDARPGQTRKITRTVVSRLEVLLKEIDHLKF